MNVSPEGRLSLEQVKYVEVSDPPLLRAGDILFNNTNSPVWVGKTTCIRRDEQVTYSNDTVGLFNKGASKWVLEPIFGPGTKVLEPIFEF